VLTGGSDVESRKISVTGCCGSLAGCPGAGRGRVSATVAADRARAGSCTWGGAINDAAIKAERLSSALMRLPGAKDDGRPVKDRCMKYLTSGTSLRK